jgi:hypothetical protein
MPCDYCQPDVYDHGWDMPDQRAVYYTYHPVQHDEECYDDCDDCYPEINQTITINIERIWKECKCGMGSDYECRYAVAIDSIKECSFDSQHKANTYINIAYPDAQLPEYDPDWESERWLRRAEGWGY